MEYLNSVANVKDGLIVSCQFEADDPFNAPDYVSLFALSAQLGGAAGIRTEGIDNIKAVKSCIKLPLIGLKQSSYTDGGVLITADLKDVDDIIEAGADIVALDVTERVRPNGMTGFEFLKKVRVSHPATLLMADVSTFEEGVQASELGADLVSTTLSGYTAATAERAEQGVDFDLIERLADALVIPVIAEGRILRPVEAAHALAIGAYAVVVGAVITRPTVITQMFVHAIQSRDRNEEEKS